MTRKEVYQKTADYIRGKWFNIILIIAGIAGINFLVGLILGGGQTASTVNDVMNNINYRASDREIAFTIFNSFFDQARRGWLIGVIEATVSSALTAGFTIALLQSVQENAAPTFEAVFENIQKYLKEILLASLLIGVIQTVVVFIPIIGLIFSAVLSYMFAYVFYIIKDEKELDVIETLKESTRQTKGHKLDLFFIDMYYVIRPLLGLLLFFIPFFMPRDLFFLSVLIMIGAVILTIVLAIRYIPYAAVARAVYYNETANAHPQDIYVEEEAYEEEDIIDPFDIQDDGEEFGFDEANRSYTFKDEEEPYYEDDDENE